MLRYLSIRVLVGGLKPISCALAYPSLAMAMLRHAMKPLLILAVLLVIPVGVSSQMACCAGISAMDSMGIEGADRGEGTGCCDQARDNAIARQCCEGGERADRLQLLRQVSMTANSLATTAVLPATPALRDQPLVSERWSPLPSRKAPDLLALHSVLLI